MTADTSTSIDTFAQRLDEDDRALLEHLESLQVRLEPGVLARVMALHEAGKSVEVIAGKLYLHRLVVLIEVRRELDRREQTATLSVREWNRLAEGTHVPAKPLRELIEAEVRRHPGSSRTRVLRDAGIADERQGQRLLGFRPHTGCTRLKQTLPYERAVALVLALGLIPAEFGL